MFGCSYFPLLRPYNKHKLQFRSQECVFLGHSPSHKGYKCLAADGKLYTSKDGIFNENSFPYLSLLLDPSLITSEVPNTTSTLTVLPSFQPASWSNNTNNTLGSLPSSHSSSVLPDHSEHITSHSEQLHSSPIISHSQPLNVIDTNLPQDQNLTLSPNQDLTLSTPDFVPNRPINTHPMCIVAKSGIVKPKINQS